MMKYFILITLFIWTLAFVLGYNVDAKHFSSTAENLNQFNSYVREQTIASVLLNNSYVVLLNYLGFITIGMLTAGNLFFNGFFLGNILKGISTQLTIDTIILKILPHVIELFAVWYSASIGFKLSYIVLMRLFSTNKHNLKNEFFRSLNQVAVCLIVILIAAFLEMKISVKI